MGPLLILIQAQIYCGPRCLKGFLTNIDNIDGTTEATLESAIDSLANLVTVGTVTTGVWSATSIAVNKGGTGLTSSSTAGYIPVSNGSGFVMQAIDGGTYS